MKLSEAPIASTTQQCEDQTVFDAAMKLIGDFWTLRIIDAIRHDEVRFCEIERRLPDANPATLTARLKRLEEADVIERRRDAQAKQSVSYTLTGRGLHILPILESIKSFTQQR